MGSVAYQGCSFPFCFSLNVNIYYLSNIFLEKIMVNYVLYVFSC